jgi:hypothetical protein
VKEWAAESGHWYTRAGEPCYTVLDAKGKDRPTTLRDARKRNLVPSVTGIIGLAAKPGLELWKANQLMLAALTLPRRADEPEKDWLGRVKADAGEQAARARDRGEAIHGAIEAHFRGEPPADEYLLHVRGVLEVLAQHCGAQEWLPEKSFAFDGFGGKVDLHSHEWVLDYKSKEFDESSLPEIYEEHPMQLAAYALGLGRYPRARTGIVWVSASEPGLVVLDEIRPEELARGLRMFSALLEYWWSKHDSEIYRRYPSADPL